MSDGNPLARKIAALVAQDTFDGTALQLGPAGKPDAITHILQAIDDTMLLRHADFAVGQSTVSLRISGKRLLMVVAASDDLKPPTGLIAQQLSADTPEAIAQVAALLQNLVSKTGILTLDRKPAEVAEKKSGSGVGIQALSAHFAPIPTAKPTAHEIDPMTFFVNACKGVSGPVITVDDGVVEGFFGNQSEVEDLQDVYDKNWAAIDSTYQTKADGIGVRVLRILDAFGPNDQAFVLAIIDKKQCLALISTSSIPVICAAWTSALSLT